MALASRTKLLRKGSGKTGAAARARRDAQPLDALGQAHAAAGADLEDARRLEAELDQARRRGDDEEAAVSYALSHSGLPIIMTCLTTAGGLASFAAAERPHPGSYVAAAGLLAARPETGPDEAIRLLEELITLQPNAAVVPDARSELEKLRGRGS